MRFNIRILVRAIIVMVFTLNRIRKCFCILFALQNNLSFLVNAFLLNYKQNAYELHYLRIVLILFHPI